MGTRLKRIRQIQEDNANGLTLKGDVKGIYVGSASTDLLCFYGGTPATQPTSASEGAANTTTGSAVTTAVMTTSAVTAGAAGAYAYATSTQADNLAAVADGARTLLNTLRTRVGELIALSNQLRADLVTLNLIKGS